MALSVGAKAPDFELKNAEGHIFKLSKNMQDKPCVIFFYPKDFTAGCTAEVCGFAERYNEFQEAGLDLIGISTDDSSSHFRFIKQYNLPFQLLSDADGKVSTAYGAKLPFINMANRVTYLLDQQHRIVSVYKGLFDSSNHIKAMLKELQKVS